MKPKFKPPFIPKPDALGFTEHDHYFMVPATQAAEPTLLQVIEELITMLRR